MKCTICNLLIEDGVFIGDGDGRGQRFAHQLCYLRKESSILKEKIERLRKQIIWLERNSVLKNPAQMSIYKEIKYDRLVSSLKILEF